MEPIKTQTIWVETKERTDFAWFKKNYTHGEFTLGGEYLEKKSDMVVMTVAEFELNNEEIRKAAFKMGYDTSACRLD